MGSQRSQKLTRDDQGLVKLVSLTVSFVAPTCASPISCGRTTPVCVSTERVYGETDQGSIVSWRYSPVLMRRACAQYRRRRRLADVAFRPLLWVSLSPHPLPGHVQSDTQLKPAVVRGPKCDERIPSSYLSCDRPARKDARRRHTTTGHGCARFGGGQRNNNNTGRDIPRAGCVEQERPRLTQPGSSSLSRPLPLSSE